LKRLRTLLFESKAYATRHHKNEKADKKLADKRDYFANKQNISDVRIG